MTAPTPLPPIAAPLCAWYRRVARPLPWRQDADPYRVWLSEVMLQQTRIEAVRPYYARFLAAAPTPAALAALPDDRLMKLWEGLGYYSRARNLKRAAQVICDKHGGCLPADYDALHALPGIGEYTAGAIASIAFSLPYPAVDGNVLRVLARLTGDGRDVLHPTTKKEMRESLFSVYAAADDPATLTQALMELGETVCLPNGRPQCEACPLAALCRVKEEENWDRIPYRAPKKARKKLYKLVLILHNGHGGYAIRRRPSEGLLADLWELPTLDRLPQADDAALDALARDFCYTHGLLPEESAAAPEAKHIFTHLEWHMQGRYLNVCVQPARHPSLRFVTVEELRGDYALPSAFRAYSQFLYDHPC